MKLLGSLIASAALAFSMLVAVPATATAAPYPGTVVTSCDASVPRVIKKNRLLRVAYRVRAPGNARATGNMFFRVYKVTKRGALVINRTRANGYTGPRYRVKNLGKLNRGKYKVQVLFRTPNNSVYRGCGTGLRSVLVRR